MNDVDLATKTSGHVTDSQSTEAVQLNHVEFLHRPGEADLAVALFQTLTCPCEQIDAPPYGKYIVVRMGSVHGENDFFASEMEEEQVALDDALQNELHASGSRLSAAYARYRALLKERPYRATHVGIRLPSVSVYDEVIERLQSLSAGRFAGRVVVGDLITHTAQEAQNGLPLKQVWVWTDLISSGQLSLGQQIEIQTYSA